MPFRTDRTVEDDIANSQPHTPTALKSLDDTFGEHFSTHGSINHASMCSRPDMPHSATRLWYFLTMPCALGYALLHEHMFTFSHFLTNLSSLQRIQRLQKDYCECTGWSTKVRILHSTIRLKIFKMQATAQKNYCVHLMEWTCTCSWGRSVLGIFIDFYSY